MKQRLKPTHLVALLLVLITVASVLTALYFRAQYASIMDDPKLGGFINSQRAIEEVKALIQLPDEVPTVYTITDISKFKDQPILAKAIPGDYFLVFTTNKRGVLYRPSEKKIIEIGTINFQAASSPIESPQ